MEHVGKEDEFLLDIFFFKGHICSEGVFRWHLQWLRNYPRTPRHVALGFLEKVNRSRI